MFSKLSYIAMAGLLVVSAFAGATTRTVSLINDPNFKNGFLYQRTSSCINSGEPSCRILQPIFWPSQSKDYTQPSWVFATWGSQGSLTDSWGVYNPPSFDCIDSTGGCTLNSYVKAANAYVTDPAHPSNPQYFLPGAVNFCCANTEANGSGAPVLNDGSGKLPAYTDTSNKPQTYPLSSITVAGPTPPLTYASASVPASGGSITLKFNSFNETYFAMNNPSPGTSGVTSLYPAANSTHDLQPWQTWDFGCCGSTLYLSQSINNDASLAGMQQLIFNANVQLNHYRFIPCDTNQPNANCYDTITITTLGFDVTNTVTGKTVLVKIPVFDERTSLAETGCEYYKNGIYQGSVYEMSQVEGTSGPRVLNDNTTGNQYLQHTADSNYSSYTWRCGQVDPLAAWIYFQIPAYKVVAQDITDGTTLWTQISSGATGYDLASRPVNLSNLGSPYTAPLLNINSDQISDWNAVTSGVNASVYTGNLGYGNPAYGINQGLPYTTPWAPAYTQIGDGSTTNFPINNTWGFPNQFIVMIRNGANFEYQFPGIDYTINQTTSFVQFTSAPANQAEIIISYGPDSLTNPYMYRTMVNSGYLKSSQQFLYGGSNIYSKFSLNPNQAQGRGVATGNSTKVSSDQLKFSALNGDILPYIRESIIAAYDTDSINTPDANLQSQNRSNSKCPNANTPVSNYYTLCLADWRVTLAGVASWESSSSLSAASETVSNVSLQAVIDTTSNASDADGDGVANSTDAFPLNSAASIDTDGDGHPDAWNSSCNSYCQFVSGLTLDLYPNNANKWKLPVRSDFDGDATTDVIMRDLSTDVYKGQWAQFRIVNGAVVSSSSYTGSSDLTVQYIANFDSNGDGVADILVRDASGSWYVYPSQNGNKTTVTLLSTLPTSSSWTFAAVGDFNSDGTDDILIRNGTSWKVFYMQNGNVSSSNIVTGLTYPAPYYPLAVGDINGDGKADLFFRDTQQTTYIFNFATNSIVIPTGSLNTNPYNTTAWTFQGLADLNGDGKMDVVLRKTSTGAWNGFVSGSNFTTTTYSLNNVSASSTMTLMSVGDFNGDGTGDILLGNSSTPRQYYVYATLPSGFAPATYSTLTTYGLNQIIFINNYAYLCTTAGTGAPTSPIFNTTQGSVTADGTVRWTNLGASSAYTPGQQALVSSPVLTTPGTATWTVLK